MFWFANRAAAAFLDTWGTLIRSLQHHLKASCQFSHLSGTQQVSHQVSRRTASAPPTVKTECGPKHGTARKSKCQAAICSYPSFLRIGRQHDSEKPELKRFRVWDGASDEVFGSTEPCGPQTKITTSLPGAGLERRLQEKTGHSYFVVYYSILWYI